MVQQMPKKSASLEPSDFVSVFRKSPRLCLILDAAFTIVAQNDAHADATMTKPEETAGRSVFEVFPDNPNDFRADGISHLRASLLNVLKTRAPDTIPVLKFDIERPLTDGGGFEVRYWRVENTPVLGNDGFVKWIINSVDDITELVQLRENSRLNSGTTPAGQKSIS